jgi:hypothetical protein
MLARLNFDIADLQFSFFKSGIIADVRCHIVASYFAKLPQFLFFKARGEKLSFW